MRFQPLRERRSRVRGWSPGCIWGDSDGKGKSCGCTRRNRHPFATVGHQTGQGHPHFRVNTPQHSHGPAASRQRPWASPKPCPVSGTCPRGGTERLPNSRRPSPAAGRVVPHPAPVLYLHPGLHYVQGGVAKDTRRPGEGSKHPCDEGVDDLVGIVPWEGAEVEGRVVVGG